MVQSHVAQIPDWVNFPGDEWESITPEEAGLDPVKFGDWVNSQSPQFGKAYGGQQPGNGGVVIARGGTSSTRGAILASSIKAHLWARRLRGWRCNWPSMRA